MTGLALKKIRAGFFSGEIQASYDHPRLLQALAQLPELTRSGEAEIILESRNRLVALNLPLNEAEEREVVVKEFRPRGVAKLREFFTGSKAKRSFYGALILIRRKIPTPEPIGYLEGNLPGQGKVGYYLSLRLKGVEEIRFLWRRRPSEALRPLLEQLASFLRSLHWQGVWHRDLSDGNILVKLKSPGCFEFFLLDTNRLRLRKKVGRWRAVKNLIRLGIPFSEQTFFLQKYLGSSSVPFPLWLWYRLSKIAYTNWVQIKKKLRLRTLARRLGG